MNNKNPGIGWFERWTRGVIRHAGWILVLALMVAAFGVWRGASHLKINQKLTALIPADYPSVIRLNELEERIGSQTDFLLELRGADRDEVLAYGHKLTAQMRTLEDSFRYVEFQRDTQFFRDNALLYVPVPKLVELRERVLDRIRTEVRSEVVESVDSTSAKPVPPDEDDPLEMDEEKVTNI